ncbi:MAG: GrdX family protein [Cloacibacillus evryensis]
MGLFSYSYVCISNNPNLKGHVQSLDYLDGGALDVLYAGRDLIHLGWELLANPLYGNFKPNQQPYRSLILKRIVPGRRYRPQSLDLIENAIRVFESSRSLCAPAS